MIHRPLPAVVSWLVPLSALMAQGPVQPAELKAILNSTVAIERAGVLGDIGNSLTAWGPEPPPKPAPRINDPRELWPPGGRHGVQFRATVPDAPTVSMPSKAGVPALGLLRDVLPGAASGHGMVRAVVRNPSELATEPLYLQVLHCAGGDPAALADALPRFAGLRRVRLGELLDNRVAAALAGCRSLVELDAGIAGLGDEGLLALASMPTLRSLTLSGDVSALSGQTVAALRRLESLRLAAPLEPWSARDVRHGLLLRAVLQLTKLRELQIALTELPTDAPEGQSALLAPLAAMPQLRWLAIVVDGGPLGSLARGLSSLPLERLLLGGGELATADVEALVGNRNLRQLDLRGATFLDPAGAAAALAKATHLRRLGLAFTNLQGAQGALLAALPHCYVQTGSLWARPDGSIERLLSDRRAPDAGK